MGEYGMDVINRIMLMPFCLPPFSTLFRGSKTALHMCWHRHPVVSNTHLAYSNGRAVSIGACNYVEQIRKDGFHAC